MSRGRRHCPLHYFFARAAAARGGIANRDGALIISDGQSGNVCVQDSFPARFSHDDRGRCGHDSDSLVISGDKSGIGSTSADRGSGWDFLIFLEGFSYRVVQQAGSLMTDGFEAPPAPDGMACFEDLAGNRFPRCAIMRFIRVVRSRKKLAFSRKRAGGVTRLVLDPNSAVLKSSNWVLTGTCATAQVERRRMAG